MSDDLIERLRECAECKSSEAWGRLDGGQDLCIGAALATEAADELARLRAEVERLAGERDQWRNDCLDANQSELMLRKRAELAEAALADERAHADAMAETLESCPPFRAFDHVTREYVLIAHRARRQG